jgi:hypothetical protein
VDPPGPVKAFFAAGSHFVLPDLALERTKFPVKDLEFVGFDFQSFGPFADLLLLGLGAGEIAGQLLGHTADIPKLPKLLPSRKARATGALHGSAGTVEAFGGGRPLPGRFAGLFLQTGQIGEEGPNRLHGGAGFASVSTDRGDGAVDPVDANHTPDHLPSLGRLHLGKGVNLLLSGKDRA